MAFVRIGRFVQFSLLVLGLSGCSGTIFKPINIDKGKSVSVDARQRLVLVTKNGGKHGTRQVVCAEPSPDAIVARASAVAAGLQGGITGASDEDKKNLAAGLGASSSETSASIGLRTQTITLLRDGLYRLCEAYMNGAVDEIQYNVALVNMDKLMTSLLAIDSIAGTAVAPAVAISAGRASASAGGGTDATISASAGEGAVVQIGGGGVSDTAAIAAARAAALGKGEIDENKLLAELRKFGGSGGTSIFNPRPPGRTKDDTSDENIAEIAFRHRRTGDKLASFVAMCVGILGGDQLDTRAYPRHKKLADRCDKFLEISSDPDFILQLSRMDYAPIWK